MARLIEVDDPAALPSECTMERGDVLMFKASGGHVLSHPDVVELIGPFLPGFLQHDGTVLSPAGSPGTVMFLARLPGRAQIQVFTGDPFFSPVKIRLTLIVEA